MNLLKEVRKAEHEAKLEMSTISLTEIFSNSPSLSIDNALTSEINNLAVNLQIDLKSAKSEKHIEKVIETVSALETNILKYHQEEKLTYAEDIQDLCSKSLQNIQRPILSVIYTAMNKIIEKVDKEKVPVDQEKYKAFKNIYFSIINVISPEEYLKTENTKGMLAFRRIILDFSHPHSHPILQNLARKYQIIANEFSQTPCKSEETFNKFEDDANQATKDAISEFKAIGQKPPCCLERAFRAIRAICLVKLFRWLGFFSPSDNCIKVQKANDSIKNSNFTANKNHNKPQASIR